MSARGIPPEGPECEWKERLPRLDRVARTLAAFANGVGGSLWVGITDDGALVGVDDPREVLADLASARELCHPPPRVDARRQRLDGLTLVEARVQAHKEGPVSIQDAQGESRVFVRDGSSTRPIEDTSLRRMLRGGANGKLRLDDKGRRLLAVVQAKGPLTLADLARAARMGRQAARRGLVTLLDGGLVQEAQGTRYSLTPAGHRKLGSKAAPKRRP